MQEQTNNVGVTHVWPYSKLVNPEAQPFSDERETDVWDELRDLTFDSDVRGPIVVATHSTLQDDRDAILKQLKKDDVDLKRVDFCKLREVEREIYHPATEAHSFTPLRSVAEEFGPDGGELAATSTPIVVPAEHAWTEKRKEVVPFHLGSKSDANKLISDHKRKLIGALVLWFPDETEHLTYLSKVANACPELPIYIFHSDYRADRYGVEREAGTGSWQNRFHTKTEAITAPENVDAVVRGLCNVGSISVWGALPKHGKSWLFLSIIKALLLGKPWLGFFEVSQSQRVVYLVPEVGLRGVMRRLRKLGIVDYLYDPIVNPDGKLFLQTLSSKEKLKLDDGALLCAVQGADVFIDPIIRYIEGDENSASDQRILSSKLLALISAEARSVWCAHHSSKAFKDVRDITTQNVLRGTGEFAAFPDIIFGVLKTNDETSRLYIKCTDARDDDEYLGDFEVELRPWIDQMGDPKLVVEPGMGTPLREQRPSKSGRKPDPDKQAKLDFAKSKIDAGCTLQEATDAVNEKFNSKHVVSTMSEWLKPFKGEATNEL